jgi:hypothetical protein
LRAIVVLCALATSGCSSASAAPAPPVFTAPSGPTPFNIAGNWSGTFQSNNLPARPITMTIVQTSSCVDGAWKDAAGQWTGAISGSATDVSFSGQISFERTADAGGACMATATVSGSIGRDGIHWTAGTFTRTAACSGDLPQSPVILVLQPAS